MTQEDAEIEYRRGVGHDALVMMAFGAVMLGLGFYLASDNVPLLRQGRLIICFVIGGGSFAWGLFRFFNRSTNFEI